jgi:hypothetical protein
MTMKNNSENTRRDTPIQPNGWLKCTAAGFMLAGTLALLRVRD